MSKKPATKKIFALKGMKKLLEIARSTNYCPICGNNKRVFRLTEECEECAL